jgi:hypothetical protein
MSVDTDLKQHFELLIPLEYTRRRISFLATVDPRSVRLNTISREFFCRCVGFVHLFPCTSSTIEFPERKDLQHDFESIRQRTLKKRNLYPKIDVPGGVFPPETRHHYGTTGACSLDSNVRITHFRISTEKSDGGRLRLPG